MSRDETHDPIQETPNEVQADILEKILRNPYISNRQLIKDLKAHNLTEDALIHRLRQLRDNAWIDIYREADPVALGFRLRYRIDVKINPLALKAKLDELRIAIEGRARVQKPSDNNPQKILALFIQNCLLSETDPIYKRVVIEDVAILMGDPADLTISVRVRDHEDIFQFVTGHLRPATGVESTSTFLEAWSVRRGKISHSTASEPRRYRNTGR